MLTLPKITVLIGASAFAGALVSATFADPVWLFLACLIVAGFALALMARESEIATVGHFVIVILLALSPLFFFLYTQARLPRPLDSDLSRFASRRVTFEGNVTAVSPPKEASTRLVDLEAERLTGLPDGKLSGSVRLFFEYDDPLLKTICEGTRLRLTTRIKLVTESELPWARSYASLLRRHAIFCVCEVRKGNAVLVKSGGKRQSIYQTINALSDRARQRLVIAHNCFLGEKLGQLLSSMVLGERAVGLDRETVECFRAVGLSHLLAASGFNLTVVTATAFFVVRAIAPSNLLANFSCLIAMACFVLLAGPSPSVVRASLVCTLVILSRCLFRTLHMLSALAIALIISVLIEPANVCDQGLQLSYAAAVGIITGGRAFSVVFRREVLKRPFQLVFDCVSACLLAQLFVMPLQMLYFARTGLLFLPANLLVVPLVAPVTVIGFVSSVVAIVLPPDSPILGRIPWLMDQVAALPLGWMVATAGFLSSFEWARINLGPPFVWSVLFFYFSLALIAFAFSHYALIRLAPLSSLSTALTLFFVAFFLLFVREPMPDATIAVFRHRILLIDSHRRWCILSEGNGELRAAKERPQLSESEDRFLAYSAVQPSHFTGSDLRQANDVRLRACGIARHYLLNLGKGAERGGMFVIEMAPGSRSERRRPALISKKLKLQLAGAGRKWHDLKIDKRCFRIICCDGGRATECGAAPATGSGPPILR